ncbi:hypothetical protein GGR92_002758 [Spirosoma lacussanchae]|uniref:hypothetical protein n=1 Tax=Spirosoma lacussanchae TaxID=1884249 RepID=UPI001108CFB1|nr:hypothetical protein [Spirosoma lacussanchae]
MSDERNIPDDLWRKVFDEADDAPPPRVWDAIERRLDESDTTGIVPLWGAGPALSRPFGWAAGLAAAVALVLVGWWVIPTGQSSESVATRQSAAPATPTAQPNRQQPGQPSGIGSATDGIASTSAPASSPVGADQPGADQPTLSAASEPAPTGSIGGRRLSRQMPTLALKRPQRFARSTRLASGVSVAETDSPELAAGQATTGTTPPALALTASPMPANAVDRQSTIQSANPASADQLASANYDRLEGRGLKLRGPGAIQRIVWFRPADPADDRPLEQTTKRAERSLWASVSVMPGAFDPAVSTQIPSVVRMSGVAASATSPTVSSRANFSIAYQAAAGLQLTEHWSLESGVGYLAGRSTVDSPRPANVYSLQMVNNTSSAATVVGTSSLYTDLLRSQLGQPSATKNGSTAQFAYDNLMSANRAADPNNYDIRNSQAVTNDYQYIQVPMQVGYQLRPRKRLSMALLGGLLTNIFVRNTVADELVITAKDGLYRPVSLAATMGARFRYRPSQRWSASVAGVYQPSLSPGTPVDSPIQTRPTSTGMTFGVDYHF